MLKIILLLQLLVADELFAANEIGEVEGSDELMEKCEKLSKIGKLSKFQKLAKLKKKLSKSGNSPNFNAKKNEPSFLTPNAEMTFNRLWLAFIKALTF